MTYCHLLQYLILSYGLPSVLPSIYRNFIKEGNVTYYRPLCFLLYYELLSFKNVFIFFI